jgi:predicted N-acetyltransferase YhbS
MKRRDYAVTPVDSRYCLTCTDEAKVSPVLDAAIRALLCACFPRDTRHFSQSRAWHTAPTYSLVCKEGPRAIGHVGIVMREVRIGGTPAMVAGVQSVAVLPSHRGRGLSRQLMTAAMEEARRRGARFGLLFCEPSLERLYAAWGWRTCPASATMRDEHGGCVPIPDKNIIMMKSLSGDALPPGDVDLCGADW